jgi:tetratricopeptide (TPR) repeat protein
MTAKPVTANIPNANPAAVPAPAASVSQPASLPQAQSPSITDDAVRIARAEMERDMYKQAAETSQKAVEHSKWMFTSVLTAIGIILALFGFAAYKETKKYEEATARAENSAKKAHECEQEAKGILANIDTQAKAELAKIKEEGNKKITELLAKAKQERQINELWDQSLRANNKQEYEKVRDKYTQIIKHASDVYEMQSYWCAILANWAKRDNDDKLFKEAHDIYDELKVLAAEHKDKSEIQEARIAAGVGLASFYKQAGKLPKAKALLDEVEPLAKELQDVKNRQASVDFIAELRQKPGMQ